jgi:5-methylcytosine-specific restriction endonuclease McrA
MKIPALKALLQHIEKEKARDYKQEYRDYHGKPKQIKERAQRNAARSKMGLKVGDPREVDHKRPISQGGSNSSRNLRAVSRNTNREKGAKKQ